MTRTSGSLEDSDELASRGNPATSARTLAQVDSAATDRGMARTAGSSGEVNEAAVRRNSSERAQARTESASTDRETTRTAGRSEDANAERALAPAEPNRTAGRAWNGAEASADAKATAARLESAVASRSPDEATIAQQLGLKVRRVVIDAGHGGHDTGAIGKQGTNEKDITLKLARRVGELLADQGLEVILTRDDDTFVRLEDRTRIANEAKGDLFISIHCNASENRKVHGIETYTLNVASDRYSIRLAARENAASEKSISDLQFILADLATKANTEESERLAKRVQGSLVSTLRANWSRVKDFGTKQALFYVLLGAKMPAVLVETSFISNPEEEKRLSSKKYQEDVARAIARGVQSFLEDRERLARVD
ncbi:MAG: N-acetylmuramoyl-L-alanine amidase [Myxococcaceae bacterium]|nr:N-acetylmuramoyl-L-alanine amidase [Myxococcaceae bacterium]